ncbi:MAG: cyclic nucleotide-binding domain-containing protein [Leptolyngbyaceae cyanobacterium MO_188.B28]|nr:cyclic nucleotide-binding domain-containing protein [Leptolyngbyaceae cyanobacterium MO_188.B28]
MLCADDLLALELFQTLPRHRVDWVCDRARAWELNSGDFLIKEGDPPQGFCVLLSGQMLITRQSEGLAMPIGQHKAPAFFGEIPVLTDEPVMVSLRALTDCLLYEIPGEDFLELLHECRDFERTVFRVVQRRLRGLESFIRNREKMGALGNLAAGLAHELNNPAAALVRALKDLPPALIELERMNLVYGQRNVEEAHTQQWLEVREKGYDTIIHNPISGLELSDREDRMLDWLEAYGVENAWELAQPLATGGVDIEMLEQLLERWRNDPTELRDMGLRWLALSFDVMSEIAGGLRGAERISELIQSMKSYSHMDQGAQQMVDIHQGIDDTLQLLAYKLKPNIEVQRMYDPALPKILAYGSELNQVWTSLIDNAIDALHSSSQAVALRSEPSEPFQNQRQTAPLNPHLGAFPTLTIRTAQKHDAILVEIMDNGPGVPAEIQTRIFDPFFTTKPVGHGSGLGLDLVRRIIENRHQGAITLDSQPGRTCFLICLPLGEQQSLDSEAAMS